MIQHVPERRLRPRPLQALLAAALFSYLASLSCSFQDCAELDAAACEKDDGCGTLRGQPIDDARACRGDHAFATCTEADGDCGSAITEAVAPDGSRWVFSNTCIPDGWQELQGGGDLDNLPECSSL